MDSSFYIITWSYYCRSKNGSGCKSYFHGWSPHLLQSLLATLQLSFPAILSQKSGLSHNVISQLCVGNQHKMGPSGAWSLLFEMHTHCFNTIQLQYLKALFKHIRGHQVHHSTETQSMFHSYFSGTVSSFGNSGDVEGYGSFVPSEHYLVEMMNRAIEVDEPDANQHTA